MTWHFVPYNYGVTGFTSISVPIKTSNISNHINFRTIVCTKLATLDLYKNLLHSTQMNVEPCFINFKNFCTHFSAFAITSQLMMDL